MDNRNNPFGRKLVLSEGQVVCRAGGRHSYGVRLPALPTKWSLCSTGSQHDLVAELYQLPPANFSKFLLGDMDTIEKVVLDFCADSANKGLLLYLERNFCPHSWINEGSATVDDALKTVEKGVTWGMDMFGITAKLVPCSHHGLDQSNILLLGKSGEITPWFF